ncbi:MAG: GtrA family protein [Anaerolineales bacterium]|nr:GtrA family protein [Anaerolineales bacterium]
MIFTTIVNNPHERRRFLRFATVGVIGAVVDFGTFNILINFIGLGVVLASVFSFIAAILSNFTWNRYWTYPDSRSKPIPTQLIEFGIVSVVGLLIRTPIIAALESPFRLLYEKIHFLPVTFITAELLGNNTALAAGVLTVMFWNFFINRYWTYGDVSSGNFQK